MSKQCLQYYSSSVHLKEGNVSFAEQLKHCYRIILNAKTSAVIKSANRFGDVSYSSFGKNYPRFANISHHKLLIITVRL